MFVRIYHVTIAAGSHAGLPEDFQERLTAAVAEICQTPPLSQGINGPDPKWEVAFREARFGSLLSPFCGC